MIDLAKAQAIYLQALVEQAQDKLNEDIAQFAIDPQGRTLVQITIDEEGILDRINQKLLKNYPTLERALGITVTRKTTVSLQVDPDEFEHRLVDTGFVTAGMKLKPERVKTIAERFLGAAKGSVIALTQEFHFHLALTNRIYQEIAGNVPAEGFEEAHRKTMLELDKLIMRRLAKALQAEYRADKPFNLAKINAVLDKYRAELMPKAHTLLLQNIVLHTGLSLEMVNACKDLQAIAVKKTATPNDVLHVENGRLATWIAGSEETAHNRKWGVKFANRQIITHYMGETVEPSENPRIQIRTPSLAMKGNVDEKECISDVVKKFKQLIDGQEPLLETQQLRKAYIYNLLTAFEDTLDDNATKNEQTKSAKQIVKGIHHYNKAELSKPNPVFCLLQNISVNGFGKNLGYGWTKGYRKELTVMAEMSLLHTVYDSCDRNIKNNIKLLFNKYDIFLNTKDVNKSHFSDDLNIERTPKAIKADLKKADHSNSVEKTVLENAQLGLKNLLAHDAHFKSQYSKLVQSLSIFSARASIAGCKSGTERHLAIAGRVAIFDNILKGNKLSALEEEVRGHLAALATGRNTNTHAKRLNSALDRAFNENGLQSAMALISLVDQGGPAKVGAKPNYRPYISRNYAEAKASVMTNLHQTKASKMQAHKQMTKTMKQALIGHPKNAWQRMKEKVGILGAVLGCITIIPLILVAFSGARDNIQRKEDFFTICKENNRKWGVSRCSSQGPETTEKLLNRMGFDTKRASSIPKKARSVENNVNSDNIFINEDSDKIIISDTTTIRF